MSAVIAFAAANLSIWFVADCLDPGLREPQYGRKLAALKTQLGALAGRPLVLLLGTSRAAYGVRPDALGQAESPDSPLIFNFGILGGGPVYELLHFRRLLEEGIRPQAVIIEIHPALLNLPPEFLLVQTPPVEYCNAHDLELLSGCFGSQPSTWQEWLCCRAEACYRFRCEMMRRLAPRWLPDQTPNIYAVEKTTPSGWLPGPWPRPQDAVRQANAKVVRQVYAPCYRDFEISARPDRALREILALCRQKNIVAALLLMPEAEELRDEAVVAAQPEVERYVGELAREYGAEVFDASRWCDNSDFFDGQHLLPDGAVRLSERLGRRVLDNWIASHVQPRRSVPLIARRPVSQSKQ
ncbi:MAG TPA: hypothetical protein VG826_19945 [Pirellulales bacterium]|nr:hypothetical protein [Pirellulales bacterium]